jgi:putative ABC transport system permease protein
MTLLLIVYRSLRQHAFSTVITALSLALAGGLLMTVWMVRAEAQRSFLQTTTAFDAVLGARGSKLQLVLNAIFHLEASPGNLSWQDYEMIRRNPAVKVAIPIAVGDNLKGYRIVGTIPELFTDVDYAPGKTYVVAEGGRLFSPDAKEAVVGSFAAGRLGLRVGDTFHPFHGLAYDPSNQHPDLFTVVGILRPSSTPLDRVVLIPIKGVQTMTGHDPRAATDISAVLIKFRSGTAGFMLDMMINKQGNRLTLAYPVSGILADLFSKISWFDQVLALVAYLVALVAAASVLASIYNSMNARKRDIAILRALGARRGLVFGAVVAESACIGAMGAVAGFAVYAVLFAVVARIIRAQTGVVLTLAELNWVLAVAPGGLIALCALGGVVPAAKAYRIPVAENLAPVS